jgi:hypothetical protein
MGPPTEADRALAKRILRPELFQSSDDLMAWLMDYVAVNIPLIPISQISGFAQFTAQSNSVATSESRDTGVVGTGYGNLATVGPTLPGLPDGKYVLLFGAAVNNVGANTAYVSPKINGTEATDADAVEITGSATSTSIARAITATVTNSGNSTVTLRYRGTAGVPVFKNRWLIVLRYANA